MSEDVTYSVNGRPLAGYIAHSDGVKGVPGILVNHGGGGLGRQARARADILAKLGYVAFAPDLFGEPVTGLDHARSLVEHFTEHWLELRVRCTAALAFLRHHPNVDATRTAAIGFCFGGQAALELGRSGADLCAIVVFHSQLTTRRPQDSIHIKAKVLVCLGDQDCFVSREDRDSFMENMTATGVDCQLLLFSGVGHSFTDPFAAASGVPGLKYDASADRRAWGAMQALLKEAFQ